MPTKTLKTRIQLKTGTTTDWGSATSFHPLKGELLIYDADTTPKIKVGTGSATATPADLPFIGPEVNSTGSGNAVTGVAFNSSTGKLDVTKGSTFITSSGTVAKAEALTTNAGSATKPVYFSNGKPVAGTYSLNANVPSDAKFTDTTYSEATTSADGLMSSEDKTKLDGIAAGANKYTHPTYTSKASGLYKVTVDGTGHVSAATAVTKSDITGLGIPAQDTTSFTITAAADDDDVVVLAGTSGANKVTYKATHAKKGPTSTYTSGNTTTSISGSGSSGTIKVPQITVDTYGHVTAAADEDVKITLPTIPSALKNPNKLTVGSKTYDGSAAVTIAASDLGLSNALHFIGTTTTALSDGATTSPITVGSSSVTPVSGDVVLYSNKEFIWTGSLWEELGDESSHALKTIKVSAGDGLTGGGDLTANRTIAHSVPSGAAASTKGSSTTRYYIKTITTDKFGHVTGVTTGNETVTDTNTAHTHAAGTGLSISGSGGTSGATTYSLKQAAASEIGGVKVSSVNSTAVTVNDESATAGRYYPVELNSDGKAIVNVPWTDNNTTYSFSANNPTLTWGTTSTVGTAGDATYKVTMPANPNTDTKVTSVANHYTPAADTASALSADASSTTAATWNSTSLVTGVNLQRDAKGHVTGVTVDSIKMPANPNVTYTHPTYTARTGKPASNQTPAFGGTATVSQVTSDGTGHVTGMTDRTITIPSTLSNGTGTAGLIKTSSTVTSNSGYTACPVISGVPYYKDTNTTYSVATTSANGLMSSTDKSQFNKEAYLSWGGRHITGGYAPIDAAINPYLGPNRLAGMKAAGITIEYSNDGGSTWTDYGATEATKVGLVTTSGSVKIGGPSLTAGNVTANAQLRITLDGVDGGVYTAINKIHLYISTSGSNGSTVTLESYDYNSSTSWHTVVSNQSITGWSGWNVLNFTLPGSTAFGGTNSNTHQRKLRFTFKHTSCSTSYTGLTIQKLYGFGGFGWTTPSNLAATGAPYSYDYASNVTFPANVKAASFTENGTALSSKYLGISAKASDSAKLNGQAASYYQTALTTAQLNAANSGITSTKVSTYDGYATTISGKANLSGGNSLSGTQTISTGTNSYSVSADGYLKGSWGQFTATGHQTNTSSKVCVLDGSGWIYYRSPSEILTDGGAKTTFTGSSVTTGTNNTTTTVAGSSHTHTVTAKGSLSATLSSKCMTISFSGSSATTGSPSATTTVAGSAHIHSVTAEGTLS